MRRQKGATRTSCPGRPPTSASLRLAEDPVHLGAADRAGALGHPAAGLADLDLAVEVALFLALHAVAVVALSHGISSFSGRLGTRAGRRCGGTLPVSAGDGRAGGKSAGRIGPRLCPQPVDKAVERVGTDRRVPVRGP